ncbi:MAG: hypothetical protein H8Z69_00875 [Nanohaloarchaea archaeon]|nr:hypothetical protein [Candidatus Nanohaloarchaea archaeon]
MFAFVDHIKEKGLPAVLLERSRFYEIMKIIEIIETDTIVEKTSVNL